MIKLIIIGIVFLLGLYFSCNYTSQNIIEGFDTSTSNCPNILIQKGKEFYLHNSKMAKIPGVNPVKFNNLEDYVEFLDWQRSQNIKCPVLFLQHSYNAMDANWGGNAYTKGAIDAGYYKGDEVYKTSAA